MTKIFISATTADLATARACAKRGLETVNYVTVEQDTFEADDGTMLERLQRKIEGCDGIVHIAGFVYGAEPKPEHIPKHLQSSGRHSYSQWEYHIARRIQKKRPSFKIYAFLTADDYPTTASSEPAELRQLQLAHRELLNPIKSTRRIRSDQELEEKVKELQLRFDGEQRLRRMLQNLLAVLIVAILIIALGGGLSQYACQAPGIHGLCKQYGWGGVPTLAQEAELRSAAQQGCDGLRRYLQQLPPPILRELAKDALETRRMEKVENWKQQQEVPMTIDIGLGKAQVMPDEVLARASSQAELLSRAENACKAFVASQVFRMPDNRELVKTVNLQFECAPYLTGFHCAATLTYVCQADVEVNHQKEICHVAL